MERSNQEQELVRYFLNDVTADERDRIGERTVVDSEYAEFAEGVALDLMDAYARNTLPAAARAKFERFFLVSDERREQVLAMSALASHPKPSTRDVTPASDEPWWTSWFGSAGFGLRLAGGFAVLALAVLQGWLISEWWPRRHASVVTMGSLTPEISVPLARSGDAIQELVVLREARYVSLYLAISDVRSTYRVELQQAGRALWRESGARPASLDGAPVIIVAIPAERLTDAGEYTVAWERVDSADAEPSFRTYRVRYTQ